MDPKKREVYHAHRRQFDKELRSAERVYNAARRDNIEQLNSNDPKAFWKEVNKLGPPKGF